MGLRLCEPLEPPPTYTPTYYPTESRNNIERERIYSATEVPIADEGSEDGETCDCIPAEDGDCSCRFDCDCHWCGRCTIGEFESCGDCCGDRDCDFHNVTSVHIARTYLVHSYAEYPLPPELEFAALENDPQFLNHGYVRFIHHAETFELKRRLTCDAWSYYSHGGGQLAERLQTLRDWIRDLPNDNSPAMIAGMVAFWQDALRLEMETRLVDWSIASLEHPLPWLRDLVAPVREDVEGNLRGLEALVALDL